MKELSIEEKAKHYDEAYKRVAVRFGSNVADEIFPELKESEGLRIIKAIKYGLDHVFTNNTTVFEVTKEQCLSWLEKQGEQILANSAKTCKDEQKPVIDIGIPFGAKDSKLQEVSYYIPEGFHAEIEGNKVIIKKGEQKPADKVEPKFKIGDWVVRNGETLQISGIDTVLDGTFHYWFTKGTWLSSKKMENVMLWTIKDAKAGDVLATEGFVFIFKEIREDKGIGYFCANEKELHEGDDDTFHIANPNSLMGSINNGFTHYTPATKEQRNQLEKAMANAGYTFDFEKKELKKIEQKPADEVEPKFKVGDWITNGINFTFQVCSIEDNMYLRSDDYFIDIETADKTFRLWTIQDAKPGDVLACLNDAGDRYVVFIFKNINSDEGWVFCFCASDANGCFCTNNDYVGNSNSTNISPATKEQRNLLFQKMREAGYEWDAWKKELKKIDQKPAETEKEAKGNDRKIPNSAWTEEDKKMSRFIGNAITADDSSMYLKSKGIQVIDAHVWLDELKERVLSQSKQEWSKEDEVLLKFSLENLTELKNRFDEEYGKVGDCINWLKSLKERYTWKPSDEQMHYLSWIANVKLGDSVVEQDVSKHLNELLEDLKKLRG